MIELIAYAGLTFLLLVIVVIAYSILTFEFDFKITDDKDEEW